MVKEHATQLHIHLLRPWEILAYKRVMKQLSKVSYERVPPPHLNILEKIVNTIESAVSSYLRNDRIYVIKEKKSLVAHTFEKYKEEFGTFSQSLLTKDLKAKESERPFWDTSFMI
jgi:hypothetical protein